MGKGAPMHSIKPPTGYKRTSTLSSISPHPAHFNQMRRRICRDCEPNIACCKSKCDLFEKSKSKYEKLDFDPCGNCVDYMITCSGLLNDKGGGVRLKSGDVNAVELLNKCPF